MRDAFKGLDKIEILGHPIRLGIYVLQFSFSLICSRIYAMKEVVDLVKLDCEIKLVSIKIIANK